MLRLPRARSPVIFFWNESALFMRTYQQKTAETKHDWYIVDAAGQRLGTLAVRIAQALSGKKKPTYTPHIDDGDHVIVINADKVELGGDKWQQKVYHRHSGFPGGLRTETAQNVREKYPERLIERAVRGMLATNRMRDVQLTRLNVYVGDTHPHAAQKPASLG
jgi:large subunit ribosomal protein L13